MDLVVPDGWEWTGLGYLDVGCWRDAYTRYNGTPEQGLHDELAWRDESWPDAHTFAEMVDSEDGRDYIKASAMLAALPTAPFTREISYAVN